MSWIESPGLATALQTGAAVALRETSMTWIPMVSEEQAIGSLAESYFEIRKIFPTVQRDEGIQPAPRSC